MKVTLSKDWTVKVRNGSEIVVPEGTEVEMLEVPEDAEFTHAQEVAVGTKMQITDASVPVTEPPVEGKPPIKPPEKPDLKPPIIDKPKPPVIDKPVAKPKGK